MSSATTKKRIYFIRHGQSMGNLRQIFQNADDPLSEAGTIQAKIVARKALSFNADVILTSPMVRAYQTAETIRLMTNLPLETLDTLHEYRAPSKLRNKSVTSPESNEFYKEILAHLHVPDWHYDDEENYSDLYARAILLLDNLAEREEETIIAVTHGAFMRILLATMMTEGNADALTAIRLVRFLSQRNTGVTSCEYSPESYVGNKWRLVAWNDYSHLDTSTSEQTPFM
ncbi:MAG: Phosphatase [Parcubacteria group bacterium GW2011_GWA2_43_11]|nr:MAG: Phosphatase [Parcubacteria group bacterium GW2011_GWC2_42_11]KKS85820.1 MAG: Phosphatase [Parcubacteria group bacterium GW2011_GWA2_43_11]